MSCKKPSWVVISRTKKGDYPGSMWTYFHSREAAHEFYITIDDPIVVRPYYAPRDKGQLGIPIYNLYPKRVVK